MSSQEHTLQILHSISAIAAVNVSSATHNAERSLRDAFHELQMITYHDTFNALVRCAALTQTCMTIVIVPDQTCV